MSDSNQSEPETPEPVGAMDESEQERLRALVRGALGKQERAEPDVLAGVQRKIRLRSRGKFYGDAWSTAKSPPIGTLVRSGPMRARLRRPDE